MSNGYRERRRTTVPGGFTLMELAVVLLLLGTLMVVAVVHLSRTHDAAVAAQIRTLAGSLQTAVSAFHANWKLQDEPALNVPGWGDETLDANAAGYPAGGRREATTVATDRDCEDIWRGLLMDAPEVAEAEPDQDAGTAFTAIEPKLGSPVAFVAGQQDHISGATVDLPAPPHTQVCQFISLHYQSVAPGDPKPTIFYDSRDGDVFVDLDRVF